MLLYFGIIIVMSLAIYLQVKLAKEDNPKYSLMLPFLFFVSSIVVVLFLLFLAWGNLEVVLVFTISGFIIANVPTLIMLITRKIVRK